MKLIEIKEPVLPTYAEFCEAISKCSKDRYVYENLGIKITAYLFAEDWSWHADLGNRKGWVSCSVKGYTATRKITKDLNESNYNSAIAWAKTNRINRINEMSGGQVVLEVKNQ